MKAVILAGGFGSRLSEETHLKPKPMVEIGGFPILWHILKIYSFYGIDEFIICCGYKGYFIKEYFANYFLHNSDATINLNSNEIEILRKKSEPWKVTLIDTGQKTLTGGRLARVREYLNNETFCFTYGDGVGDINIKELISSHKVNKCMATITAVQPPGRYGALKIEKDRVISFQEKPRGDNNWVNGGFFILSPDVFEFIDGDDCIWEDKPLKKLASKRQLNVFKHEGFWQPMDTLRDKNTLENLWKNGNAPWKVW